MPSPLEALKDAAAMTVMGTGALELKARRNTARFYFQDGALYAITIHGSTPPVAQRLQWSLDQDVHSLDAQEIIASTPDSKLAPALLRAQVVSDRVISEISRDFFLYAADEILLTWGEVRSSWKRGETLGLDEGLAVPRIEPDRLISRIERRYSEIEQFTNWAGVELPNLYDLSITLGDNKPEPQTDVEALVLSLAPSNPTLGVLAQESGWIGTSQIIRAIHNLWKAKAITLSINGTPIHADKEEVAEVTVAEIPLVDAVTTPENTSPPAKAAAHDISDTIELDEEEEEVPVFAPVTLEASTLPAVTVKNEHYITFDEQDDPVEPLDAPLPASLDTDSIALDDDEESDETINKETAIILGLGDEEQLTPIEQAEDLDETLATLAANAFGADVANDLITRNNETSDKTFVLHFNDKNEVEEGAAHTETESTPPPPPLPTAQDIASAAIHEEDEVEALLARINAVRSRLEKELEEVIESKTSLSSTIKETEKKIADLQDSLQKNEEKSNASAQQKVLATIEDIKAEQERLNVRLATAEVDLENLVEQDQEQQSKKETFVVEIQGSEQTLSTLQSDLNAQENKESELKTKIQRLLG